MGCILLVHEEELFSLLYKRNASGGNTLFLERKPMFNSSLFFLLILKKDFSVHRGFLQNETNALSMPGLVVGNAE